MVGIISNPSGTWALGLLQSAGSSSAMNNAITGQTKSTGQNVFDTIRPGSANQSISDILQQQKGTNQKNKIYADIALRLDYMQKGQYKPKADWEKVAAYAMQTGKPMVAYIDTKGKVQAQPQSDSDLSKFNLPQQTKLFNAMDAIFAMSAKMQANATNQGMIGKLEGAESDLIGVYTGQLPPQTAAGTEWESQGVRLMQLKKPFTIALDNTGNLMVQDQAIADMSNLPADQQQILRSAVQSIPNTIGPDGFAVQEWQTKAQSFANRGIPFHLELDTTTRDYGPKTNSYGQPVDVNGNVTFNPALYDLKKGTPSIVTKENNGANIVPDFLKKTPYPNVGDESKFLKDVKSFIEKKQAYFLDFGPTGSVVAKAATAQNLIKYNTPKTTNQSFGAGSIMSLIA